MIPQLLNPKAKHIAVASVGGSRLFNEQGELNATTKKDALIRILATLEQLGEGNITTDAQEESATLTPAEKREILTAAYHDASGEAWREIGAQIAGRLTETNNREGFARRFMIKGDLQQGNRPRFEVDVKNVTAVKAVGTAQVHPIFVRDKYIEVDEIQFVANPYITENDLNQGSADQLDKAYLNALEQIQRQEDILFRYQLLAAAGALNANPQLYMTGAFSSAYLTEMHETLGSWGLTAASLLMTTDIIGDIIGQSGFTDWFDPVSKYEMIQTGKIATVLGMDLVSDGYRHKKMRVLTRGEVFALASPEQLGGYTDRGPVQSAPTGPQHTQTIGKGWIMHESYSSVLANAAAVVSARKI
jgi:hypothetical protein